MTEWTELREFAHTLLTESYILSWNETDGELQLDVDLCLSPAHSFYEKLRPSEDACVRPAVIEFPNALQIIPIAASLGLGRISGFRRTGEGIYNITGEFGDVEIHADRPMLRFREINRQRET
jgi:hypothetical protein